MGFLIQSTTIKREIIIPEADVLLLGTTIFGYNILPVLQSSQAYSIKNCYVTNNNVLGIYTGYQHIYLNNANPNILAIYEENAAISYSSLLYLNIGSSHPPTKLGGSTVFGSNGQLFLNFSNTATGNGDLKVYIEYDIINK